MGTLKVCYIKKKILDEFYQKLYFKQGVTVTYNKSYNKRETFLKKFRAELIINFISENLSKNKKKIKFLEIGAGEGHLMMAGLKKKWLIKGVDYQSDPIQKFNKKVLSSFSESDPSKFISAEIKKKEKYDIVVIQNVLEHVLYPEKLILDLKKLINNNGLMLIQVPNDFSVTQLFAKKEKKISKEYWFLPPQHLNYFNSQNLPVF